MPSLSAKLAIVSIGAITTLALLGCASGTTTQSTGTNEASSANVPSAAPATPGPTVAPTSSAGGPERAAMAAFNTALIQWNAAATPVMADMNDPSLDVPGFGDRTEDGRANMRASLAALKGSIPADIDAALASALTELVGSYDDKMTAIDDLATSAKNSDLDAYSGALVLWQRGIDRQKAAIPKLLEAAKPFLTAEELDAWHRLSGT